MRTREQYDNQIADLQECRQNGTAAELKNLMTDSGIKSLCSLHETHYWHITSNHTADLMHDFLEGVAPFELKLILHQLIEIEKLFSLDKLNERINSFAYGITDVKNKPVAITSYSGHMRMSDNSLGQKAMQMWCLFRLLPLFIADLVPVNNAYWKILPRIT